MIVDPAFVSLLGKAFDQVVSSASIRSLGVVPMGEQIEDSFHVFFPGRPVELLFHADKMLTSIFFDYCSESPEWATGIPAGATRALAEQILGKPSRSGEAQLLPILGLQGAWDRWDAIGYSLHVQFSPLDGVVAKVTLMHPSVVPA